MTRFPIAALALALTACGGADRRGAAIVGATLIDGTGAPALPHSVVIVSGNRIAAAGTMAAVPIPAGAEKVDGRGKWLIPALRGLDGSSPGLTGFPIEQAIRAAAISTIAPGQPARLVLLRADPAASPRNLLAIERVMSDGVWTSAAGSGQ